LEESEYLVRPAPTGKRGDEHGWWNRSCLHGGECLCTHAGLSGDHGLLQEPEVELCGLLGDTGKVGLVRPAKYKGYVLTSITARGLYSWRIFAKTLQDQLGNI